MNLEQVQKPVIYVLVGLPGSGKSTWTKKKLEQFADDIVVISSDDIIEKFAAEEGKTYTEVFDKYVGRASAMMKTMFKDAKDNKRNIIWDQTNLTAKKRKSILEQLPDDYFKVAVIFTVGEQELNARLDKRAAETGKIIPPHIMKSMVSSYTPPTKAEGFNQIIRA